MCAEERRIENGFSVGIPNAQSVVCDETYRGAICDPFLKETHLESSTAASFQQKSLDSTVIAWRGASHIFF